MNSFDEQEAPSLASDASSITLTVPLPVVSPGTDEDLPKPEPLVTSQHNTAHTNNTESSRPPALDADMIVLGSPSTTASQAADVTYDDVSSIISNSTTHHRTRPRASSPTAKMVTDSLSASAEKLASPPRLCCVYIQTNTHLFSFFSYLMCVPQLISRYLWNQ